MTAVKTKYAKQIPPMTDFEVDDENMLDKIKQGLKHYVNVKGKVFYKSISKYPYKIVADAIDIYPPENELSKLSELRGIEPGLTGDMTTEEFIRSIREESE